MVVFHNVRKDFKSSYKMIGQKLNWGIVSEPRLPDARQKFEKEHMAENCRFSLVSRRFCPFLESSSCG